MDVRIARTDEFDRVWSFYGEVIDGYKGTEFDPLWEHEVYPERAHIQAALEEQSLRIAEEDGSIIGALIINHDYNDGYRKINWPTDADEEKVMVIHTLAVHPNAGGKGVAKQLTQHAIDYARSENQEAIRLDVLHYMTPAAKAYERVGFKYVDTVEMFYPDTGWTDYMLYEYVL